MNGHKLAVCVYACRRKGRGGADDPGLLFRPLLGKPAAWYAVQATAGLKPDLIIVIAPADGPSEKSWLELAGGVRAPVFFHFLEDRELAGDGEAAGLTAAARAASFLEKYPSADIVLVPASMPMVTAGVLRPLVRAHRRSGCALTFLARTGTAGVSQTFVFSAGTGTAWRFDGGAGRIPSYEALRERLGRSGAKIGFYGTPDAGELNEIRSPLDLAAAAAALRMAKNEQLLAAGADLADPGSLRADWEVVIGKGTRVGPFVCLEGRTVIGRDCVIHPYCHITDGCLGDRVMVMPATVIEGSTLEAGVQAGPFSRLRPGTVVRKGAHVGNFVEMKKTDFGPGSKAMHLSYLGDSLVGGGVNIGAGTITCNYDGVNKNRTEIGPGVFIGSGSQLVAPVKVGAGAYVAAGSTVTEDVEPEALAIARARQVVKPGWAKERARKMKTPKKA